MPVQVKKKSGFTSIVVGAIKFISEQIVVFFHVVFFRKKCLTVTDKRLFLINQLLIKLDQIGVGVGKDIFLKFRVEKHRG